MLKTFKNLTSSLASVIVLPYFIRIAKTINQIHLNVDELFYIAKVIKKKSPCSFLVFGLGNDSSFWVKLNRGGKTVFIEDDPMWFSKIMEQHPLYSGYLIDYGTYRTQWQELLNSPEKLMMSLPEEVENEKYDCILVDGPHGWVDSDPGRMKSIFTASRLISENGDIFIHDCDRIVEIAYCNQYLGAGILKKGLKRLRHYYFTFPVSNQ